VEGKELRKESMFYYFSVLDRILDRLSANTGISKSLLRCIEPSELGKITFGASLKKKLEKRFRLGVQLFSSKKMRFLEGPEAKTHLNRTIFQQTVLDSEAIVGMVSYPGVTEGPVRIVNTKADLHKVRKGDILVSISTNPDLVPAMKKASAIVTDVGGITSHAAIISREFQIPCIVGTRQATKVLKDGDMVHVDATQGIVVRVGKKKK
jgi:phosphohistidine swiveling domain-containing protein